MPRIALFTTECAQLGDAIADIFAEHGDDIALVVTSDVYSTPKGGMTKQLRTNLQRSGPAFVKYLLYGFVAHDAYIAFDRARSVVSGQHRRRRSIAEQCAQRGIRHLVTNNVNKPEVVTALQEADLDFIVIYWFDQIIRENVINAPRRAVVNVHAAYLPNCRGLFPVLYSALEDGAPFGISAHTIEDTRIDAGPVLAQRVVRPPAGRSVLYYDAVVNRAGVQMLSDVLADFDRHVDNQLPPREGSYYSYPTRDTMRQARAERLRLSSLRDLLAVCRGVPHSPAQDTHARPSATGAHAGADRPHEESGC